MKFDINDYPGKYVMHCKTEAEAREFCNYVERYGLYYNYNINSSFGSHERSTCYNFNFNTYGSKSYYVDKGYTILEWSDFTTEFTKADLKNGMVVECGNGKRYLVLNEQMISRSGCLKFEQFTDCLELKGYEKEVWAVSKIYKTSGYLLSNIFDDEYLTLIWERKEEKPEPIEMTIEEICAALGKEIKIVKG